MSERISAIIPTYREADTAPGVVTELHAAGVAETIVVDDSPTLATAEAVREAHPETVVIHRDGDGLASAVIRGFAAATGDTYLVVDGDGQHPPAAAARIARRVTDGEADLVLGTRHADGGAVADAWPAHRRLISRGADLLARVAVPPARETTDPMSGLFAVDAAVVDSVLPRLRPAGYKISLELLARCPLDDVAEVGYEFRTADSESNLGAREYARYLRHLARLARPSRSASVGREQVLAEATDGAD
jgi:dolichol-phosphate mannosyltransferase